MNHKYKETIPKITVKIRPMTPNNTQRGVNRCFAIITTIKISRPHTISPKLCKSINILHTTILVTKWRPFKELFKSKITSGRPNTLNFSTIEELNYTVYTYKTFVIKLGVYTNKRPICLYNNNSRTLANSSVKLPLASRKSGV